jgi:hypothetical protein
LVLQMTNLSQEMDQRARRGDDKASVVKSAAADFLQLLARAVHQFHTYPAHSPLCVDAVAACHAAFTALELEQPLVVRVGARELIVDDDRIGRGTNIEHELWRPLHRARVSSLEFQPSVSTRDWAQFCPIVASAVRTLRQTTGFAEFLLEAGVSAIAARVTPRPELFEVGAPPEPVQVLVDRERTRQASLPPAGPAQHLYPPDKGWVRLDPTAPYESISLLDLMVLVNEPAEAAAMLTRLIDEDAGDESARAAALGNRYGDLVRIISALDGRLGRILFSKLARAVLALDADRRRALLQNAVLPGLLDGRTNADAVLCEFPDVDLADTLCLLLELDAASPHVLSMALDRLRLTDERRAALTPMIQAKLRSAQSPEAARTDASASLDGVAASLIRVTGGVAKDFSEFAAFELAVNDETTATLHGIRDAIAAADACDAQVGCALGLARIEPNPAVVKTILERAIPSMHAVLGSGRWDAVLVFLRRLQTTAATLDTLRPDVAPTVRDAMASFCNRHFIAGLADLAAGLDGRARAAEIIATAGPSFVPAWIDAFDHPADKVHARHLVPSMSDCVAALAPALSHRLPSLGVDAACASLAVLAAGGAGYEEVIAGQALDGEERRGREAMRALARIASPRAAALIASHIEDGPAFVQPAAEEALWRLPLPLALAKTHELLGRRDFVVHHPQAAARLLERAAHSSDQHLEPLLEQLTSLRFHFWSPAVARVGAKARGLRQ